MNIRGLFLCAILTLLLLVSCGNNNEYNSAVTTEEKRVVTVVIAKYHIDQKGIDEYTTVVQYNDRYRDMRLTLEIHDKSLYDSVRIGGNVTCAMITTYFETGRSYHLQWPYKHDNMQ